MEFGDIVLFRNIVFKNEDGTHKIDPYFYSGRPCVFVGEYEDFMYFLPLTRLDDRRDEKFFDIIIQPDKRNKLNKVSKINYTAIIKKPSSFYEVKGNIGRKIILEILKKSLILYNCDSFDYSDIVSKIMAEYVVKENINLVDKKTKGDEIEEDNLSIGDIVLLKQIVFSNNNTVDVDHAFNSGRPCVFIGKKDNKMYFFPLRGYNPNVKEFLLVLNPNEENELKKKTLICSNEILEINCQSFQIRGNIGYKNVLKMIKNFILYYYNEYDNIKNKELYEVVFNILNNEILSKNKKKKRNLKKIKKN